MFVALAQHLEWPTNNSSGFLLGPVIRPQKRMYAKKAVREAVAGIIGSSVGAHLNYAYAVWAGVLSIRSGDWNNL